MLSHGLMTALFFALIGMIYGRTHTRDVRQLSGLMKVMPFLAVGYVIAGLANLGLPGLSGFVAEMTIFNGAFMNADTFHRVVTDHRLHVDRHHGGLHPARRRAASSTARARIPST